MPMEALRAHGGETALPGGLRTITRNHLTEGVAVSDTGNPDLSVGSAFSPRHIAIVKKVTVEVSSEMAPDG